VADGEPLSELRDARRESPGLGSVADDDGARRAAVQRWPAETKAEKSTS